MMHNSVFLPLLFFSLVTRCSTAEDVQMAKQHRDPCVAEEEHVSYRRFRRGWIWKQLLVQEEDPNPRMIGQIKSDYDKGDFSIKYLLSGEGAGEVFIIDEYSGEIYTLHKLDREEKAFYILRSQAINRKTNQPVEPESEFIIKVQDINDNMPQFQNEPYVSVIPEMSPSGTTVVQVTATDADDPSHGNHAKLIYSILQGEPYFSVEPKTGIIVTSLANMDRETREKYFVVVQVKDMMGLSGSYSATTTVTIILSDVNDNGPVFQHSLYSFAVAESAAVGMTVGRIKADDSDVGVNARMTYGLEEKEGNGTFQIHTDPVTQEGVILLAKTLDYETKKRFVIIAEAINDPMDTRYLGYDEFRDQATIKIFVEDVDEAPVFPVQEYEWKVQENMAAGTTVGTVSAMDRDAANNSIRYNIDRDSSVKKLFKIDPNNGTIITVKSLDRESVSWHNFTVTASETKQNRLFSSVPVFIKVLDVNDNAPQFSKVYQPYVCEGAQSGELVQLVSAMDLDDPGEGHHFYFSLVPEKRINPNFTLRDNQDNTAGILTRRSSFSRQDRTQYLLPVVIADSGVPPLSSTATLTITVCRCEPAGHCPSDGVQALALPMGLGIYALVAIVVCVLTVTVLIALTLAVRSHKTRRRNEAKQESGPVAWADLPGKVFRHSEPEATNSLEAYSPVPLRRQPKRRDRHRFSRAEIEASIRMSFCQSYHIGPEDEAFRQFMRERLLEADTDPFAPPFDCVRTYAFEGRGSSAGSLSSLGSLTASETSPERPQDSGRRLVRLAPWHGGSEEETSF
uniref:Cadherin-12 n=1 Tax=Paramormyrops kingsleyae TaxID=1676925 RepID=A0A3B3SCH4_9TELE|nr:cadherin-7-like isoform X1 [Paramormyrops kingsleyae]XP_023656067.1 cadherin-7-like isoform X1 [Paramormyrops kingsleyae]XP_023656068.1 cadherin-7-like isoform X1 [Paramormyrops kingsleyae]